MKPGVPVLAAFAATLVAVCTAAAANAEIRFQRVSESWGLDFRHHHGGTDKLYMNETMGSGVLLFDYDLDGDTDVFFVDSSATPGYTGEPGRSRLFRNDGEKDGVPLFVDVTDRSDLDVVGYGMGVTAGDVDGDGDEDVYVTSFDANQLFRNDGDGTFTDVSAAAGVDDTLWGASAAFADGDLDGDLDLYVVNYVDFGYDNNKPCGPPDMRSYCHPDVYNGQEDRYYRNRGDGTFEEVAAKVFGDTAGKGLGVIWSDFDNDGFQDAYVANDMTFNFQFQNNGDGTFEDVALLSGTAVGDHGQEEASMGIAVGDADGDGRPEVFVTHLDRETNAFYSNVGDDLFNDQRFQSGLAEASIYKVGFGTGFADLDNDGDQDLAVANGHVVHNIDLRGTGSTYKQVNQVFENVERKGFREVLDSGVDAVLVSRGLATGDLDRDGLLDMIITNSNDVAEVYENVTPTDDGWLRLDLVSPSGNRRAVGARVELTQGEDRQVQEVRTGASYLSQSELTLHFGLDGKPADELAVRWPGAGWQKLRGLPSNRRLRLSKP